MKGDLDRGTFWPPMVRDGGLPALSNVEPIWKARMTPCSPFFLVLSKRNYRIRHGAIKCLLKTSTKREQIRAEALHVSFAQQANLIEDPFCSGMKY